MPATQMYDNASDEINSRILNMIIHAEKMLTDLPKDGKGVRLPDAREQNPEPTYEFTSSDESVQPTRNSRKYKSSKASTSRSSFSILPQKKKSDKAQWQTADGRGVVVNVSVKVPHRSQPIQLSLDCPRDEKARVLVGEKWLSLEDNRRK